MSHLGADELIGVLSTASGMNY